MVGSVPTLGQRRKRNPGYFLGALSLVLLCANLAQGQIQYYGSSMLLRRTSPVGIDNAGQPTFQLQVRDEFGLERPPSDCQNQVLGYQCAACSPTLATSVVLGTNDCEALPDNFLNLALGFTVVNRMQSSAGEIQRNIAGATSTSFTFPFVAGELDSEFGFTPATVLTRNVLNQPPIVQMLPLVQVRFGCPATLDVPTYDIDRFDTLRCQVPQGVVLGRGISVTNIPNSPGCRLNVPAVAFSQAATREPISLEVIDTSLSGQDMSRISLQFTIEWVQGSGSVDCTIPGYTDTSIFPSSGIIASIPTQSTFSNTVRFPTTAVPQFAITSRGGRATLDNLSVDSSRLRVRYNEVQNPLPEVVCYQYRESVVPAESGNPSEVICAFFEQARAEFRRTAIAGTAGFTVQAILSVTQPSIPGLQQPLTVISTPLTQNSQALITSPTGGALDGSPGQETLTLFLSGGSDDPGVAMLSINEVAGPELLVYIHQPGSVAYSINFPYIRFIGVNTAQMQICKDRLDVAAVVYLTATGLLGLDEIDRSPSVDPHIVIPAGQLCITRVITLPSTSTSLSVDAEGPYRVTRPNIVLAASSRCFPTNPCLNNGACSDIMDDPVCDCTGTGFGGNLCQECGINPCSNNGVCSVVAGQAVCDCTLTAFIGATCTQPLTMELRPTVLTALEGQGVFSVSVCFPMGVTRQSNFRFSVSANQGFPPDFTLSPQTGTIFQGNECGTFNVDVLDNGFEPQETFLITLTALDGAVADPLADVLTLTINPVADPCNPNPCGNLGICAVVGQTFTCDCSATLFTGPTCTSPIMIQFQEATASVTVTEGDAPFELNVCYDPLGTSRTFATSFSLQLTLGTGVVPNGDFMLVPTNPAIAIGQMCTQIGVTIVNDAIVEDQETFSLTLLAVDPANIEVDTARNLFLVFINDNDMDACLPNPCANDGICTNVGANGFSCECADGFTGTTCTQQAFLVGFELTDYTISASDTQTTLRVCLFPRIPVNVDVTFFVLPPPVGTLVPGAIMPPNVCDDITIVVPGTGNFEVTLFANPDQMHPEMGTATVSIEAQPPTVSFSAATNTVSEGVGITTVDVCLSRTTDGNVVVDLNQVPALSTDFSVAEQITIFAGQLCQTLPINVQPDQIAEPVETLQITLASVLSGNAVIGPLNQHTLTVNDDDAVPGLEFRFDETSVMEGGAFRFRICITNFQSLQPVPTTVTVALTQTFNEAIATDISNIQSPILISNPTANDPCSAPVEFMAAADNLIEGDETFQLNAVAVFPSSLGFPPAVTLTILNAAAVGVTFNPTIYTVPEGGTFQLTVCGDTIIQNDNLVGISSLSPTDFVNPPTSITIQGGQQCGTVGVTATVDNEAADETFFLAITSLTVGTGVGNQAQVTIEAMDLVVDFELAPYTVTEGGSFQIQVCGNTIIQTNNFVVISQLPFSDFVNPPTSITIPGGQRCGSVTVAAIDDNEPSDETFTLSINSLTSGTGIGNQADVIVDVIDLVVSFQQTTLMVTEGDNLVVNVCNNRLTNQPNEVDVQLNFQAPDVTQDDFVTTITNPIQVTIPANTLCASFALLTASDGDTVDQFFTLSIDGSSLGTQSSAAATAVIRALDDAVALVLGPQNVEFSEDNPVGLIELVADQTLNQNLLVSIAVQPISATNLDFGIISHTVTLPANTLVVPIDIQPLADDLVEVNEVLEVSITGTNAPQLVTVMEMFATSTVTILNSDVSEISITKNDNGLPVAELTGQATFSVCSQFNLPVPLTVGLDLISGSATLGQDFSAPVSGTSVVIPAGRGDMFCVTYTVPINDNSEADDPLEDFTVAISSVGPLGVAAPGASSVVCVIADDRPCDPSISGDWFLLTLTPPYDVDDNYLYLVSNSPFDVSVSVNLGVSLIDSFTVPQGGSYVLPLPDTVAFPRSPPDVHSQVITIQSTGLLHVYSQNRRRAGGTGDSTQIYPYRNLGNYYVVTAQPGPYHDSFVSIATREANSVAITFSVAYTFMGVAYQPYETAVVPLAALQAIYLSSSEDLTGTIIVSSEPLFVLDGVICNNVPSFFGWCDLTAEQLLPALSVCRLSVVGPAPSRDAYTVHFTAIEDNTEVYFRGETITLMAGEQARRFVRDDNRVHEIASNNPVYIYQYLASFTVDFQTGDPAKLVLPPVGDFTGEVNFYVPDIGGEAAITIYVLCAERVGLLLNGIDVSNLDYYIAEGKVWCSVMLTDVTAARRHTVSHVNPDIRFYVAIFNQMRYFQEGSAMSAGFNFGCGDPGCSCSIPPSDPCFSQPCLNGGICRRKVGSPSGYFCRCRGDYFGENCNIAAQVCTVSNFRNYVQFDQSELRVDSNCRYTLLSLPNIQGAFTIQIWYDDCPTPPNVKLVVCFIVGNYVIYFRPGGIVEVNGANAQFPIVLDGIQIRRSNDRLVFVSDEGIRVVYDDSGDLLVQASNLLGGQITGLCGDADGLQDEFDDFQSFGLGAPIAFANSFNDQSLTSCILPDPTNPPLVPPCGPDLFAAANERCNILNDPAGPFSPCFGTVSQNLFVASCTENLCDLSLDYACENFERYVRACSSANVDLFGWRAGSNCAVPCDAGSFTDCANSCPRTCYYSLTGNCECIDGSCFEGCECPPGYYLSNGRCVTSEGCGCIWQGLYYDVGESYVNPTCTEKCICTGRGTFTCQKYACNPNAVCTTTFQQQPICRCAPGYTGDGEVCILETHKGITRIEQCYGQQCDGFCMTSPNYNGAMNNYNDWETVLYVVGAPCAMNIRVECPDISTESGKDFLHIGPGADVPDPVCVWRYDLLGVLSLTGSTFLDRWDSNDWLFWMWWNTDRTTTDRGWQCCFYVDDPCRNNPCANGGICQKQPGSTYTCKCPRGFAGRDCLEVVYYCGSYGDPHYYTFDGLFYDFQGNCEYLLVTSTGGGMDIEIRQSLQQTTPGSSLTASEVITIDIQDFEIELREGGVTLVNQVAIALPYVPPRLLPLSIRKAGQFVVVTIDLQSSRGVAPIEVWWNGQHFVEIQWPSTHRGFVNGLCGIPDGEIGNDHTTLAGVDRPDHNEFALNFRNPPTCFDNPAVLDPCLGGTDPAFLYASFLCTAAFDANGAFSECMTALPIVVDTFGQSCLYDGCATLPNQEFICDTLQALEHYCLTSGIRVGSWRTPEICGDCCPPNSVWNDCGPANPPTCANPTPQCDRLCTAGCQCLDGYIWDNGECIPADQCGCFDDTSGRYYPRGTVSLNNLCNFLTSCVNGMLFSELAGCAPTSQQCTIQGGVPACTCSPGFVSVGASTCQVDPCAGNRCNAGECLVTVDQNTQVIFGGCRCPRGFTGPNCLQTERVCSVFGDPHHKTFDNRFFEFHGRCSYILARDGCTVGVNTFIISADYSAYGKGLTAVQSVTIQYQGDTIVLNRFGFSVVNDIFVFQPAQIQGGIIYRVGNTIIVETPDFEVRWNNLYNVDIRISANRQDVCGLCGNNNGNNFDDFISPLAQSFVSPTDFGNSWVDFSQTCTVPAVAPPDPCSDLDDASMSQIETICGVIREGTGACPGVVDPEEYVQACIQDGCANPLSNEAPANTIWAYLEACTSRLVSLGDFTLPPPVNPAKSCPPNSVFSYNTPECEPSCSNLVTPVQLCTREPTLGCRCLEGYVREGASCVLPSACGCTDNGRYYPVGQEWIRSGCLEKCQCNRNEQGNPEIVCCPYMCSPLNSLCSVNDGARGCVCMPGFVGNGLSCLPSQCTLNPCQNQGTCRDLPNGRFQCLCRPGTFGETCEQGGALCYVYGDPYFETFDGRMYDVQGICEYELVDQCGATIPFRIYGTLENIPNSPLSRLASVRIQLTDPRALEYNLRSDGVYLNNNPAPLVLPYYSLADSVEIYYSGNDVWFRSRFFNVRWDRDSSAIIEMRSTFFNSGLCGLCGNYDLDPNNDFITAGGVLVGSPEALANAFRVGNCPLASPAPADPCAANPANAVLANTYCAIINDPFGPFADCPQGARDEALLECQRDICQTGQGEKICPILNALEHRCLVTNGGPPVDWRPLSPFACPTDCPTGATYSHCVPACGHTCSSSFLISFECNYPCVSGCQCEPGYVLQGSACIPATECGCYDPNGNYYAVGESYLINNCGTQCRCTRNGFPECSDFQCPQFAACSTNSEDQSQNCICQPGFLGDGTVCTPDPCSSLDCGSGTCVVENLGTYCICPAGFTGSNCELEFNSCYAYGDPHYETFDDYFFDYHGSCSYTLASVLIPAPGIATDFDVIVHNSLVPGSPVTITDAISVAFDGLGGQYINNYITMDSDGVVTDVNGRVHNLPWEFHDDVRVESNQIVISVETTFGVRVEWHYLERVAKVSVTNSFANRMEGLCGNFDGDLTNDLDDQPTNNAFGNRWLINENGFPVQFPQFTPRCSAPLDVNTGPFDTCLTPELQASAGARCNIQATVNCRDTAVTIAFTSCRSDVCAKQAAPRSQCSAFAFAAHVCEDLGVDTMQWRRDGCEIACPGMSTYSRTAPACPLTCFDLRTDDNSPCTEAPREGCVCPDGYYWSGNVCVLPENCGCVTDVNNPNQVNPGQPQNGVYFVLNEVYYTTGCAQRCQCTLGGTIVCQNVACNVNAACLIGDYGPQCVCNAGYEGDGINCLFGDCPNGCGPGVCGDQNGRPGCICPMGYTGPDCGIVRRGCFFRGDPHYQTFDGTFFDYQGDCSYIMVLTAGSISITNTNEGYGTNGAATTNSITIELQRTPATTISFLQGRRVEIQVDSFPTQIIIPPYVGPDFRISDAAGIVRLHTDTDIGLEVEWNGVYDGAIYLPNSFADSTRGLCGNYNSDPADDFSNLFGFPLPDADAFGEAFQSRDINGNCEPTSLGLNPCDASPEFLVRAQSICSVINDAAGPLAACSAAVLESSVYYDNCVFDICHSLPAEDDPKVCGTLQAFVHTCQQLGVIVGDWRASIDPPSLCAPSCPTGSVFSPCTSLCPLTCGDRIMDVNAVPTCTTRCQEGCECFPGLVWQGGICIPPEQCGCFDQSTQQFFVPGSTYLRPGCTEQCVCMPGGVFDCTQQVNCHCLAECSLMGSAYQCTCPSPFVGDGFNCAVSPCLVNNPCTGGATCLATNDLATNDLATYCSCPPGRFGDDCGSGSRTCQAVGGELFFSYDGEVELFYGQCTYVLTRDCDRLRTDYFEVLITLTDENDAVPFAAANQITSIMVIAGAQTLTVTRSELPDSFFIDSEEFAVVVKGNFDIVAWRLVDRVVIFLSRGVIITFTQTTVKVTTSNAYAGALCGICGDSDDIRFDGSVIFQGTGCPAANPETPCDDLNADDVGMVQTRCTQIIDSFGACATNLLSQCLAAGCANYPDLSAICAFRDIANTLCLTDTAITTFEFCVPTCGPSQIFSNAISACPRTCNDPFPLPDCPIPPMSGCECSTGRILNNVGMCVLPAECGCQQLTVYYEIGEEYYTPACGEICECQLGGFPSCRQAICPPEATCLMQASRYTCQCPNGFRLDNGQCVADPCVGNPCANGATCVVLSAVDRTCECLPGFDGPDCTEVLAVCKIFSNPYIVTFDALDYHFIGGGDTCRYRLATGGNCGGDSNPMLQDFDLTASFNRDSTRTAELGSIRFTAFNFPTIEIRQGGVILRDGVQVYCPVQVPGVLITCVYDNIIVRFNFGLNIVWREDYAFVYLNRDYSLSTCGLCGNLDENPGNDNARRLDGVIDAFNNFGDSYEVGGCALPTPPTNDNDLCDGKTASTVDEAESLCSLYNDRTGPFGQCIQADGSTAMIFFEACRNQLCEFLPSRPSLCSSYEAFAHYCRNRGFLVRDWRTVVNTRAGRTICDFTCPAGSTYTTEMITCPPSCGLIPTIDRRRVCLTLDLEGCRCDPGLELENNRCVVPSASCGCLYEDAYLPIGTSVLDSTCQSEVTCAAANDLRQESFTCPIGGSCVIELFQRICSCPGNTILVQGQCRSNPCQSTSCNSQGRCVIDDLLAGTFFCICNPSFTGAGCTQAASQCSVYGDPNFRTFDGEFYQFRADSSANTPTDPPCQYYLVNSPNVAIIIETETSVVEGNSIPMLTRVNRVRISEVGINVEFRWRPDGTIYVLADDIESTPPFTVAGGAGTVVTAGQHSYWTFFSTRDYSVRVSPLRAVDVKFEVGPARIGLCGDANGVTSLFPGNQNSINSFGDTARVPGCTAASSTDAVVVCNPADDLVCALLDRNVNSILQPCFATVDPDPYYAACRKDLCTANRVLKACAVIATYAQWCRDSDITVGNWRANTDCAVACQPNSFFDISAPAIPDTCSTATISVTNRPADVEGCTCAEGFLLAGTTCIPEASCGCTLNGMYYRRGDVFFQTSTCIGRCTCPLTGDFDPNVHCDTTVTCHPDATCMADASNNLACVCRDNLDGDGINCFQPGCGGSPCQNGGTCMSRPRPNQPDNPDFLCRCPAGFVGQDCSLTAAGVQPNFISTPTGIELTSLNFPELYPPNVRDFTQVFCDADATAIDLTFNAFTTETAADYLFVGVGFPTGDLGILRTLATDNAQPLPSGVEALSGLRTFSLLYATNAVWFYFDTNDVYELTGYSITVNCVTGAIPAGTEGNCFDGEMTRPNNEVFLLSDCEQCICENGELGCSIINDALLRQQEQDLNMNDPSFIPIMPVRGQTCSSDAMCAGLAGSRCIQPSCLGTGCVETGSRRVCSSGDSLRTCALENLCIQIEIVVDPDQALAAARQDDILALNGFCDFILASLVGSASCFRSECTTLDEGRKRDVEPVTIVVRIAARSHLRPRAELEEDIGDLRARLPNVTAELMEKYDYIISTEFEDEAYDGVPDVVSGGPDIDGLRETNILDTETTPWTYLLAALALILLLVAVGLVVTIVSYYRKQSSALNVKFEPAAPSYPRDNLPESLEMVKSEGHKDESVFARRIPLDDSTGNRDNVFALSWERGKDKDSSSRGQSKC